ncbi:helix-turn-helix domain-containing protein [Microbispora bryophytorum]|uniref:helix-turn-helix domain-containing protein n=1 Tax=Microbispora bryophytorum TaxID=1460882 RepID=UPI003717B73D
MLLLEHALDAGPTAHGWIENQRWTLARVTVLIEQLHRVSHTLRGTSHLVHRLGQSLRCRSGGPAKRDEEATVTWVKEIWPRVERPPGTRTPGCALRTRQASR